MLPWKYHQLTPRDHSGELLLKFNRTGTGNTNPGSSGGKIFTVPREKFLILTNWGASGTGVAIGSAPIRATLNVSVDGISEAEYSSRIVGVQNVSAQNTGSTSQFCYLLAPPGADVQVLVEFNTAGSNDFVCSVSGILIPKGDLSTLG